MPVARIVCSIVLVCEAWNALGSVEDRIGEEGRSLIAAITNAVNSGLATNSLSTPDAAPPLNPSEANLGQEKPSTKLRPFFVTQPIAPLKWSVAYNSFRKADEFECTIPLAMLPIPPESIRRIGVEVCIRHLSNDAWGEAIQGDGAATAVFDQSAVDFAGTCLGVQADVKPDGIPTLHLRFHDYLALLANKKVETGKMLSYDKPVSQAVADFLSGMWSEKLEVVWVGAAGEEPVIGDHVPKVHKKRGKKKALPAHGKQNYLDVITDACARVGVVPRINVNRLELAFGGTYYQSKSPEIKSALVVGQTIESFEAKHELVGVKPQPIQVCCYDPDTGRQYTHRYPADPKSVAPVQVQPGQPPRLPPLFANLGIPGAEQLDESVLVVPVPPLAKPDLLPEMAKSIFMERTRQRIRYDLKTHAPWSDPQNPDAQGGDLLRLRAGDVVSFGYRLEEDNQGLLAPAVEVLAGAVGEEGIQRLLMASGTDQRTAAAIAHAITGAGRLATFAVDEARVSGGAGQDAEIEIRIVNFTQVVTDAISKGEAPSAAYIYALAATKLSSLAVASAADIKAASQEVYAKAAELPKAQQAAVFKQLDTLFQGALKGK